MCVWAARNLGGGTITLAQMESCLAELSKDASGVLEMYDPYKHYPWQSGDPNDIAFGIKEPAEFPGLKGKIVDPDGGGTHSGPFALFQQRSKCRRSLCVFFARPQRSCCAQC